MICIKINMPRNCRVCPFIVDALSEYVCGASGTYTSPPMTLGGFGELSNIARHEDCPLHKMPKRKRQAKCEFQFGICGECHYDGVSVRLDSQPNYCPNCGAANEERGKRNGTEVSKSKTNE